MAKPVRFGSYDFKTKKDATEDVRKRIAKYEVGQTLGWEDFTFFMSLFTLHDQYDEKVGPGVSRIVVERDFHNNKCLHLSRIDSSKVSISWVHCLKPFCIKSTVSSAFRRAVKETIMQFKSDSLKAGALCPINKSPITYTNSHVAYINASFETLLEDFLKAERVAFEEVQLCRPSESDTDQRRVISDMLLVKRWQAFHRLNAKLELLSDVANMSKRA